MKFVIEFATGNANKPILEKMGTAGTDFLDMFREEYPQYNFLTYKDVHYYDYCPFNGSVMEVEISEELARESGYFKGKTGITVYVGDFFNKYVEMEVEEEIRCKYVPKKFLGYSFRFLGNEEVKYLHNVDVRNKFNTERMLDDWKEAGFPKEWGIK